MAGEAGGPTGNQSPVGMDDLIAASAAVVSEASSASFDNASLSNVVWLSPEKSRELLLAASFDQYLVIFKVIFKSSSSLGCI